MGATILNNIINEDSLYDLSFELLLRRFNITIFMLQQKCYKNKIFYISCFPNRVLGYLIRVNDFNLGDGLMVVRG